MNLPAILLGWILASLIGLAFHLIRGGSLRRIVLYLLTAWLGFAVGHLLGSFTGTTLLRLGAINMFSATIGAALSLILFEVLSPEDKSPDGRAGGPGPLGPR